MFDPGIVLKKFILKGGVRKESTRLDVSPTPRPRFSRAVFSRSAILEVNLQPPDRWNESCVSLLKYAPATASTCLLQLVPYRLYKMQPWALVTPASRGIGLELARRLLTTTNIPVVATARKDLDQTRENVLTGLNDIKEDRLHVLKVDVLGTNNTAQHRTSTSLTT